MSIVTNFGESLLQNSGQAKFRSDNSSTIGKIVNTAIVRSVDDNAGQNRIKVEIVSIDENGNIQGGLDRNIPTDKLPICIPLMPEFIHVRPQVGECVIVISENPNDITSVRYFIGPLISSQLKLPYQSFTDSFNSMFNTSTFSGKEHGANRTNQKELKVAEILPTQTEISLQGRVDANITFSSREVNINSGLFNKNSLDTNLYNPCKIQLKQFDNAPQTSNSSNLINQLTGYSNQKFSPFSQQNIIATNINLISTEGKNRNYDSSNPEFNSNKRLNDFGSVSQSLHPLVFGDELIVLLKLILSFLKNHIHTPQSPALPNSVYEQLLPYLNGNKLQDLISNNIRVN